MKLIFMGTPAFAVPTLERLAAAGHQIIAVYTQPDRPKGRGQHDAMSPVKEAALRLGLAVHQPERVKRLEIVEQLFALSPRKRSSLSATVKSFRNRFSTFPRWASSTFMRRFCQKYRGAAPIQWAIARGETHTGVTTMKINEGLDTGDMLLMREAQIGPEETAPELSVRPPADAGADLAVKTIAELDRIAPQPQDDSQATYAPILKKEDGHIDWQRPAREILNRMRGFDPWPGAYANLRGQKFQIRAAAVGDQKLPPGALRAVHKKLYAGCGDGESLELREVQMEGKKRMTAAAFLNGFTLSPEEGALHEPAGWFSIPRTIYAGIRKVAKDDVALIVSDFPAAAAAVFTKNLVVAAPVEVCRHNLKASRGVARAILVNAGNANCATQTGEKVALQNGKGRRESSRHQTRARAPRIHRCHRRRDGRRQNHRRIAETCCVAQRV